MIGWTIGVNTLSAGVFSVLSQAIGDKYVSCFLVVAMITVFTVVWGVVVGRKQ